MGKKTLFLIGILLTIIIGSYCYWVYCCGGCCVKEDENSTVMTQSDSPPQEHHQTFPFTWSDTESNTRYHCTDNFSFNYSQHLFTKPIADSVKIGIDKLKQFLVNHPEKDLLITGYHNKMETNGDSNRNLGIERAQAIKDYLVSQGMSSSKIYLTSSVSDQLYIQDSTIMGANRFLIGNKDQFGSAILNYQKVNLTTRLKAHPLNIYFDSNMDKLSISKAKSDSLTTIVQYLKEVSGSSIKLVGHTDSTGDPEYNMELGMQRANFLKSYIVKQGVDPSVIAVESAGQNRPIADNSSPEGRSLNRRAEITIQ